MSEIPNAYRGDEPYVFVSYAHEDAATVYPLIEQLQDAGVRVFFDEGISPGSEWSEFLAGRIKRCDRFLYFITPASVASENCRRELNFALEEARAILAAHLEPTRLPDGMRLSLNNRQAVVQRQGDTQRFVASLVETVTGSDAAEQPIGVVTQRGSKAATAARRAVLIAVLMVAVTAVAGVVTWMFWPDEIAMPGASQSPRVALLPLRDVTQDGELGWLTDGLTQEIADQIRSWRFVDVVPASLSARDDAIRGDADYLIDGVLRRGDGRISVSIEVVDVDRRQTLWARQFSADDDDLSVAEQDLAREIAFFFGESLGGLLIELPDKAAYDVFLRLLPVRVFGDHDRHRNLLEEALVLDPDWTWGKAELASMTLRAATYMRDASYIDAARDLSEGYRDGLHPYFYMAAAMDWGYFSPDRLHRDSDEREIATQILANGAAAGLQGVLSWMVAAAGLYPEALAIARRQLEIQPFNHVPYQTVVLTSGNLGDAESAYQAGVELDRLFPDGNGEVFLAWSLPATGRLDEARAALRGLESEMASIHDAGSWQLALLEQWAYQPMRFELARAEGDVATATEVAGWFADRGMHAHAGLFYLILDDPRAEHHLEVGPDPSFDPYFWRIRTLHLPPALKRHPLIRSVEDRLGFTSEFRQALCGWMAAMPPETFANCDPGQFDAGR